MLSTKESQKSERKTIFIATLIIYRAIMDYIYGCIISPVYSYMGFINEWSYRSFVFSWVIFFLSTFIFYKCFTKDTLSGKVMFMLYLLSIIPFTSLISYNAVNQRFIIYNSIYWIMLIIISPKVWSRFPKVRFRTSETKLSGETALKIIAILSFILIVYISGRYAGFRINLNIDDVYGFRAEAARNTLPTLIIYPYSWSRFINVILIAYFTKRKMPFWTVCMCLAQLLSFGYDGMKSTLISTILVLVLCLYKNLNLYNINFKISLSLIILELVCIIESKLIHTWTLASMFFRRSMFLPVLISSHYVDFFSNNTPDFFRGSFLRHMGFVSPYGNIGHIIADLYFNKPGMNSNNGLISDAFTNFGAIGVVFMPIILGFIFLLLDRVSDGINRGLIIAIAVPITTSLMNSFLFTVLLTHGLLVAIIMLFYIKKDPLLREQYKIK